MLRRGSPESFSDPVFAEWRFGLRLNASMFSLWIAAGTTLFAGAFLHARDLYSDFTEKDPVEIRKMEIPAPAQPSSGKNQDLPPEVRMIFRYATAFSPRLLKGGGTQTDVDRYLDLLADDPNEMELISLLLTMTAKNNKLRQELMTEFKEMVDADPGLPCLAVITAENFFIKKDFANAKKYLAVALPFLTRPEITEKLVRKRDVNYQLLMSALTKYMDCVLHLDQVEELIALEKQIAADKALSADPDLLVRSISCYFSASERFKKDPAAPYFVPGRKYHTSAVLDQMLDRYAAAWNDPASVKVFTQIKDMIHLQVVRIMQKHKKLDKLDASLRAYHKKYPTDRLVMYMLAGIFTVQEKHVEAAKMWKSFLSGQKKAPPALYLEYARALRRAKDHKNALSAYELLLAMTPDGKQQLTIKVEAVECAWEGKLFAEALQKVEKFFHRTDMLYHQLIIMTHLRKKDTRAAYRAVNSSIRQIRLGRVKDTNPQFWILCADVAEKNKDIKLTEEILLEQIKKDPKNATLLNFLGYVYANHNMKLNEAKKLLEAALKETPDAPEILDSMAWALYKLKDYQNAKKYILRSLELYKQRGKGDDAVLLNHAGDIFFALGEKKQACDYWRRAIEKRDPENDSEELNVKELQRKIAAAERGMKK